MRKMLVIVWLVAGCASASAEPLSWQKYTVPETAATVDLPTTLFSKDVGPTDQGKGRRFTTADTVDFAFAADACADCAVFAATARNLHDHVVVGEAALPAVQVVVGAGPFDGERHRDKQKERGPGCN